MTFAKLAVASLLAAAAAASPLEAAAVPCGPTGATTTTVDLPGGATSTLFASTFYDGVFLDCHGYSTVAVVTKIDTVPTTTVHRKGQVTSASYACSPTPEVPCSTVGVTCRKGTLTTTTTAPGGLTSTQYGFSEPQFTGINCKGHSAVDVITHLKVKPTTTVTVGGSTGIPEYTCKPTAGC